MVMKFKQIIYISLVAMMAITISHISASAIEVTSNADRTTINIGDKVILSIVAEAEDASGYEVRFPEKPENIGDFTFIESFPVSPKWNERGKKEYRYVFTIYDTGTHVIPPVPVEYKKVDEDKWRFKESPQVPIEVESLLTEESRDIRGIKGLLPFKSVFWKILVIALVLLILIVFGLLIWKYKHTGDPQEEEKEMIPAHVIAYTKLNKLKAMDLPGKGLIKEYYTRLSDILRCYLENRFSFKAPEMTTEEFMEAAKASSDLETRHKDALEIFLSHCDMVKFAKYRSTKMEMFDSFKLAEEFVEQTAAEEEKEEE